MIDQAWVSVIAALGASALTAAASLGVVGFQARAAKRAQTLADRRTAYAQLITSTGLLLHSAGTLNLAMTTRTGLTEGLNVAFHIVKPVDAFELDGFLRRDTAPLYAAWTMVWTVGTPAAIKVANELIDAVGVVIGAATVAGQGRSGIARFLAGEKWSDEQVATWQGHVRRLAKLRLELAELARKELGQTGAALTAEVEQP